MKQSPIITLLTDFGHEGGFVSALKGVILGINRNAQIVDMSHEIGPQDIFDGAFTFLVNYKHFPKDTIHVGVVDPGVGSRRKLLCAQTPSGTFVVPDNGLVSPILEREKNAEVYELANPKLFLPVVSNTFHGRDKLAPAAAHLSKGFPIKQVGPKVSSWQKVDLGLARVESKKITGQVIHADRFGNLITNISGDDVKRLGPLETLSVRVKGKTIPRMVKFFSEVRPGDLLVLVGSSNFVEVACNLGSAAERLKVTRGEKVEILA